MLICLSCLNNSNFTVQLSIDIKTSGLELMEANVPDTLDSSMISNPVCSECRSTKIKSLERNGLVSYITARQLINSVSYSFFSHVKCKVNSCKLAKELIIEKNPELKEWLEDSIPGDVLISASAIQNQNLGESEIIKSFIIKQGQPAGMFNNVLNMRHMFELRNELGY